MLEDAKEFEEGVRCKRRRERWTVDIGERSHWLFAGALDGCDTRSDSTDDDIMG